MLQIEDVRVFINIVESGGVARAAEAMNIAKSAVSRRLRLIEERYNVQLVDRRPGVWEVTPAGHEFHQRALQILSDIEDLDTDFSQQRQSLAGPLSVSVSRDLGLNFLQTQLLAFAARYPEIQLTLDFDNRLVDLDRENYDLAIRISREDGADHMVKLLGKTFLRLYASRDYGDQSGLPETFEGLSSHPLLHYGTARRAVWQFETQTGPRSFAFQPALNSNSGRFLLDATLAGHGIALLPDFIASESCQRGALVPVLPHLSQKDRAITLVYSKKRRLNRRMRAFIDEINCDGAGP